MKKLSIALAIAGFVFATVSQAQSADPKFEWAARVVASQQGPELDRLIDQLALSTTQPLLENWAPKLEVNVPQAKQQQAKDQLNEELKKYTVEVSGLIGGQVKKVSTDALIPAYMERFTLDELKQLATFFESDAVKKYQASAPELSNVFVRQLVEATRTDVEVRARQFDDVAAKVVGAVSASKNAPAAGVKPKAPAKK